jgi:hypothetical protein
MKTVRTYLSCILAFSAPAFASPVTQDNPIKNAFIDQASVSISSKNYYLDRSFSDYKPLPGAQDWAQGLIVKYQSAYTPGILGFGLDLQSLTSIKLQGNSKYLASGLLPTQPGSRKREDSASELGFTVKLKYQDSELKLGNVSPFNPVIFGSVARLLPQTFRGVILDSKDITALDVNFGYIDRVNQRDSTNDEALSNSTFNGRFKAAKSDHLVYAGAKYALGKQTQFGLYHLRLDDIYAQTALSFKNTTAIAAPLNLITDLRAWQSQRTGQALAGNIDNRLITANFGINAGHHTLTFSGMHNSGETAHPYLAGGEVLTFIDGWSSDFLNPKENVYSLRYDYDFKNKIPGLKLMTRYIRGNQINLPRLGGRDLTENSWDIDLQYTVPTGKLKGLGLRARYDIYDNDFAQNASFKPAHETRINVDYTWKF